MSQTTIPSPSFLQRMGKLGLCLTLAALSISPILNAQQAPNLAQQFAEMQKRQKAEAEAMARQIAAAQVAATLPADAATKAVIIDLKREVAAGREQIEEQAEQLKILGDPLKAKKEQRPRLQKNLDYVWTLMCGMMVFFMQAGFALLEMGSARAKNCINCAMKGLLDFSSAAICYLLFGFTLMFGASSGGFIGGHSFWLSDFPADSALWTFWFFQVVFAGAACTIASGAMAERTKFVGYMVYTALFSGFVYPIFGHWVWGSYSAGLEPNFGGAQGWLEALHFHDFAGSTVVHGVGGACALAGIMIVGPRVGRFAEDGTARTMPGHNMPLAFLGTFILFFSWFAFNAGSSFSGEASIGRVAVNTCVSGSAGGFFGLLLIWRLRGAPDAATTMNGLLCGCVSITAASDCVTPMSALMIGSMGGAICSLVTVFIEKVGLDDVVGAVPCHLAGGIWGTVAVALFHEEGFKASKLGIQLFGGAIIIVGAFIVAYVVFRAIDVTIGLRASDEEQEMGLDFAEHATNAYPDFKMADR
jgi:ammonium transporter, Amt family